jgi:hypothetical protein
VSGHTKWSELRDELRAKAGAEELMTRAREESAEELRLHALRRARALGEPDSPRP